MKENNLFLKSKKTFINFSLILISSVFIISSYGIKNEYGSVSAQTTDIFQLGDLIDENINKFNESTDEKEETFFSSVTSTINVYDLNNESFLGVMIIFDQNSGYLFVNKDFELIDHNYEHGLTNYDSSSEILYYDTTSYYDVDKVSIYKRDFNSYSRSDISSKFHWHADEDFMSAKSRYLISDFDSSYTTLAINDNTAYKNKVTWSTYQGSNNNCAPLAIANLLWTYKVNNVVDLTNGASSASVLASNLESYVGYTSSGTLDANIPNASDYFSGTGYYISSCNVVNGISDTLGTAPLIACYHETIITTGHTVLVTGKGYSIYNSFFNIKTSWDICNTWYGRYTYSSGYLRCKYWVDNEYITSGYALRNSEGEVVAL